MPARSRPVKFRIPDLMVVAGRVMEQVNATIPTPCSSTAPASAGASSIAWPSSAARPCRGIDFGARADRTDGGDAEARYANKRAEMWGFMKEWCKAAACPTTATSRADLTAVDYGYDASDAILLERKDDMRRRGLASPDDGDALALTFAYPVARPTGPRSAASRRSSPDSSAWTTEWENTS